MSSPTDHKVLPGLPDIHHRTVEEKQKESDRSGDFSLLEYDSDSESSSSGTQDFKSVESPKASFTPSPQTSSTPNRRPSAPSQHRALDPSHSKAKVAPPRPTIDTTFTNRSPPFKFYPRSPLSPNSRSWYEFDLAVVVALVSPIGNWLTGGDHIKNLLLVVLLIFYLHQIIEIPWALYQKARPRRRPSEYLEPSEPADARYAHLASAELRRLELFFLFCTLVSPLAGALLLRYASAAVLGPESVSWFSTGLFVLATGMRPWAHLVDRLNERTMELHDFIHYPGSALSRSADNNEKEEMNRRAEELERKVVKLEKSLASFKKMVVHSTEEVYDYLEDSVGALENSLRAQGERCDEKVDHVELTLAKLKERPGTLNIHLPSMMRVERIWHSTLIWTRWVMYPLRWFWPVSVLFHRRQASTTKSKRIAAAATSPTASHRTPISPTRSSTLDDVDWEEEGVVYESYPLLIRPVILCSALVSRMVGFVMFPFTSVIRMMVGRYN